MNAFQLIDALSASFFGLLGIWATVVQRHWFLRLAVVVAFLLAPMVIPAYEVVIEFAIQVALVAAVTCYARHGFRGPWKFSVGSALLLMVVVAVSATVVAQAPNHVWTRLPILVGIGLVTAYATLLCLWIVCGASRLRYRLGLGMVGVALLLAMLTAGGVVRAQNYPMFNGRWWQQVQRDFNAAYLQWHAAQALPTMLLAVGLTTMVVTLAKLSGWFDFAREQRSSRPYSMRFSRGALVACLIAIVAPLFLVLYKLATPPDAPTVILPSPNGYDDFVAAGKMAPSDIVQYLSVGGRSISLAEQRKLYQQLQPVIDRIVVGLTKECRVADPYGDEVSAEYEATLYAIYTLVLRIDYLETIGSLREYTDECLLAMNFEEECFRGGGVTLSESPLLLSVCTMRLSRVIGSIDARACQTLALELMRFDESREPFHTKVAVQRILDQRSDWSTRLRYLLTTWSGDEPYQQSHWGLGTIAEFRLLIVGAALQAYSLDHGSPPNALAELTPRYLPELPLDPFTNTPFKYIRSGATYKAYSISRDYYDDGGVEENLGLRNGGDLVFTGPAKPTLRKQIVDAVLEVFQKQVLPRLPQLQP